MACTNGSEKKPGVISPQWINFRDIACTFYGSSNPLCLITFPIPTSLLDIDTFCQSPPPPMPTFDLNDFFDAVTVYNKMRATVLHLKWYDWCQCTNPAPPPTTGADCFPLPVGCEGDYIVKISGQEFSSVSETFQPETATKTFPTGSTSQICVTLEATAVAAGTQTYLIRINGEPVGWGSNSLPTYTLQIGCNAEPVGDTPDPQQDAPEYPEGLPPPPPPADCSNCPPGPPGEDAVVEFESVNVDVLKCKPDGTFETESAQIQVIKSDSGSQAIAFQKLFESLELLGIKCDPPTTTTETVATVIHPGTLIDLTDKVVRINFEVSVIPTWAGRRFGESDETSTDDLIYAGGFSIVKGLHKSVEIPIQWYKQFVEVSNISGLRLWVVPGFEVTVSVEKLPEDE